MIFTKKQELKNKSDNSVYKELFDKSSYSIVITDLDGFIMECNEATESFFGEKKSILLDKKLSSYIHNEKCVSFSIPQPQNGEKTVSEQFLSISEKNDIPVEISCTRLSQDQMAFFIRDITNRRVAEEKTAISESRLKAIFNNTQQAFLLMDSKMRLIAFNNEAANIAKNYYNITLSENLSVNTFLHEKKLFKYVFQKTFAGNSQTYEYKILTSVGKLHWFEISMRPWYNNNEVVGVVLSSFCIDRRKEMEERLLKSKQNLKAMFDSSPQLYHLFDRDKKLLTHNKVADDYYKNVLGVELTPNYFKENEDIICGRGCFEKNFDKALNGERIKGEQSIVGKDGKTRWYEVFLIPVKESNGKISAVAYSAIDISYRKIADQKLRASEKELRELNASKDKFFSIIAHDLRTPFVSMMNLSNMMFDNIENMTKDEIVEMHHYMHGSTQNVMNLLDNLLKWSQSQSKRLNIEPKRFNLLTTIDENVNLIMNKAKEKHITLTSQSENIFAYADENMISTVLRNLLSNAMKFTNEGGKVVIETQQTEGEVVIKISDNGVGISEKNQKNLFRFDQQYSTKGTADEKGTGLGLILCREFVEKNNGTISIESEIGKGTTFTVTLPTKI